MAKNWISLILAASAAMVVGCSSAQPIARTAHTDGKGVPEIDEMISEMKSEFIETCYNPVLKKQVPETRCQTDLFMMLERRYRLDYSKVHVDMASDDIFFRDVDARVRRLVRSDAGVREQVKTQFTSLDDLMSYYKNIYGFSAHTQQAQNVQPN